MHSWSWLIVASWSNLFNIGSGNGLVPDSTKPLPEPMLTWSIMDSCGINLSVKSRCLAKNQNCSHIAQEPMSYCLLHQAIEMSSRKWLPTWPGLTAQYQSVQKLINPFHHLLRVSSPTMTDYACEATLKLMGKWSMWSHEKLLMWLN